MLIKQMECNGSRGLIGFGTELIFSITVVLMYMKMTQEFSQKYFTSTAWILGALKGRGDLSLQIEIVLLLSLLCRMKFEQKIVIKKWNNDMMIQFIFWVYTKVLYTPLPPLSYMTDSPCIPILKVSKKIMLINSSLCSILCIYCPRCKWSFRRRR